MLPIWFPGGISKGEAAHRAAEGLDSKDIQMAQGLSADIKIEDD